MSACVPTRRALPHEGRMIDVSRWPRLRYLLRGAWVTRDTVVHPTAKVWQFASVIRGAHVGAGCVIGAGAVVDGAVLGERVHVQSCAVLGPGILVGDEVFIGPGVTMANDGWPRVNPEGFDLEQLKRNPCVIVEDGASICAGAVICPGVRIGARAMVRARTVVEADADAPPLRPSADVINLPRRMRSAA